MPVSRFILKEKLLFTRDWDTRLLRKKLELYKPLVLFRHDYEKRIINWIFYETLLLQLILSQWIRDGMKKARYNM